MKFTPTQIEGVVIVEPSPHVDERGAFIRTFCQDQFSLNGLQTSFVQCSISSNLKRGTLRGLHFQAEPFPEVKLVRCARGAILDVVLDLRITSPTFRQHVAIELTESNMRALYVPAGCAHGFQTLSDNADVFYQISKFYHADLSRGVRWNDPAFAISWPIADPVMSERDRNYPDFES